MIEITFEYFVKRLYFTFVLRHFISPIQREARWSNSVQYFCMFFMFKKPENFDSTKEACSSNTEVIVITN